MSHTNASPQQVLDVMDTDLTASEVSPFLTAAQRFVTDNLENQGVGDATLTEIERHLAAEFATALSPTLKDASRGDVSETYQRSDTKTKHLETAMMLDPTGIIASAFARKKAARWKVGTAVE